MTSTSAPTPSPVVYQGQFGPFTIEAKDRREVIIYRLGLTGAALCFLIATGLLLGVGPETWVLQGLSWLYGGFWLSLGVSLVMIHIYLKPLHRLLQVFWLIGGLASLAIALRSASPLALTVYQQPAALWGIGFTFAALTGIFFKEAFCFNRLETKFLTPLVPLLLLGHLTGALPDRWKSILLVVWAINFAIFALRKLTQAIPPDIGDKSVFEHLAQKRAAPSQDAA